MDGLLLVVDIENWTEVSQDPVVYKMKMFQSMSFSKGGGASNRTMMHDVEITSGYEEYYGVEPSLKHISTGTYWKVETMIWYPPGRTITIKLMIIHPLAKIMSW